MADDLITKSIEFLQTLKDVDQATIKFKKKDNSIRIMKCTLNFDLIPKKDRPKKVNLINIMKLIQDKGIIHVYDLEKKGWRAVTLNKTEWIKTPTKQYKVKM